MISLLFLLLPLAALSGWYFGYKNRRQTEDKNNLPLEYFIGLKYLLDEQHDKAVDIFIRMLEVNSDTVETHLALGSLFCKRGEVDRAIRLHQNLIARPQLSKKQRMQALLALAQDYMRAGVLDRAENLFLEIIELNGQTLTCFKYLQNIYEQQKEWQRAIVIARRLEAAHGVSMRKEIAHYYCELGDYKKAASIDRNCARASILQGNSYAKEHNFKYAIRMYKKVAEQDADYFSEVIKPMAYCYENLQEETEFISYLEWALEKYPRFIIILELANFIKKHRDAFAAIEFIAKQIERYPSLRGVELLTELYIDNSSVIAKEKLLLLRRLMQKLLSERPVYRCEHCGFASKTLYWHCPGCRRWSSVKPIHGLEGD